MTIKEIQDRVHKTAREHGWWPTKIVDDAEPGDTDFNFNEIVDLSQVNIPEKIALIHSELSEALEHYRNGSADFFLDETGKPDGFAVELADCLIRILDLAGALNIDIEAALEAKMNYNDTRPFRHGNKKC